MLLLTGSIAARAVFADAGDRDGRFRNPGDQFLVDRDLGAPAVAAL